MGLFSFKSAKKLSAPPFDPAAEEPAIRCSICTGEQVAGFRSKTTGHFREVTLINGIHPGMSKDDVFKVFFKKYPKSYTADVQVLKVISGAGEVAEIYTFKGQKLRHIKIETEYKYY